MATQAARIPARPAARWWELGAFLALTGLAELLLTVAMASGSPGVPPPAPVMIGVMWAPALCAIAVALASRRSLRGFGWAPGQPRYLAIGYLVPFFYGGLCIVLAQALGAGEISLVRWATGAGRWGMAPTAFNGALIQMTVLLLPGMIMGAGEEIGWRGYLAPRLGRFLGFWGVVNASYVIWLAFHVPGMLVGGYHGGGTPFAYQFACFAALLYPGTVLMTWLRFRSGSLWPSVVYHGAHNLFVQVMWASAFQPNARADWWLGEFGALTPLACAALVALLVWRGGVPATAATR